jgi:hypothetical protein
MVKCCFRFPLKVALTLLKSQMYDWALNDLLAILFQQKKGEEFNLYLAKKRCNNPKIRGPL